MFQFTTTNVINSATRENGEAVWAALNAAGKEGTDIFHVNRVADFKKANIEAVYKTTGKAASPAKVIVPSFTATAGQTLRLSIYVGLSEASLNSKYSNDFKRKGKPFTVEFPWITDEQHTVENLVKIINKYQVFVFGEKLLKVSQSSPTHHLVIEAVDEYQRFVKLDIDKFEEPSDANPMGKYTNLVNIEKISVVKTSAEIVESTGGFFKGDEGTGTYHFILHNLRIPTTMNTRAFGVKQDEAPIPGALYDEYVIHYCVDRGILGSNAVGDVVKSKTTHVFYVKQGSKESTAFDTALKSVFSSVVEVKTKAEGEA